MRCLPIGPAGLAALCVAACASPSSPEAVECRAAELEAPLERSETADGELFALVPEPRLTQDQSESAERILDRKGIVSVRFALLTDSARSLLEEGRLIGVRVSDRARTIVRVDRARDSYCALSNPCDPPGRYVSGRIVAEPAPSRFSLLMREEEALGSLVRGDFVYIFEPLGDRLTVIAEGIGCEMWKGMVD